MNLLNRAGTIVLEKPKGLVRLALSAPEKIEQAITTALSDEERQALARRVDEAMARAGIDIKRAIEDVSIHAALRVSKERRDDLREGAWDMMP
jgi:hypothetical protein